MTVFKKGDRVVCNEPNNTYWTGITGTFDRYENGFGYFVVDLGFGSKSVNYGVGTRGAGVDPEYLSPISPAEPTDEELAAEYRDCYERQSNARNALIDRGYVVMFGGVVSHKRATPVIKITKTVTTTKEL